MPVELERVEEVDFAEAQSEARFIPREFEADDVVTPKNIAPTAKRRADNFAARVAQIKRLRRLFSSAVTRILSVQWMPRASDKTHSRSVHKRQATVCPKDQR